VDTLISTHAAWIMVMASMFVLRLSANNFPQQHTMKRKSLLASVSSTGPACRRWIPALSNGCLRQWHLAVLHGIDQLQNDLHLQLHYWT
jgi:hypothetical protein